MRDDSTLLEVRDLQLSVDAAKGKNVPILRGVSFAVGEQEVVAVVGESGSGKSMTTRSILRLLPRNAKVAGQLSFEGRDIFSMGSAELAKFRGTKIGMIYQDPRAHINPLWTIGDFLLEGVAGRARRAEFRKKALSLLTEVGVRDGDMRMRQYPHQLSGGLLQRVMIVAALMSDPDLIIADESTTALDVTVQADVMRVFRSLKSSRGLSMLFITHDLDLAASVADNIVVMYAGQIVEKAAARELYERPAHPYTAALLASRPHPSVRQRLVSIPGRPQSAAEAPAGCAFASRCRFAQSRCLEEAPLPREVNGHHVSCHFAETLSPVLTGGEHSE